MKRVNAQTDTAALGRLTLRLLFIGTAVLVTVNAMERERDVLTASQAWATVSAELEIPPGPVYGWVPPPPPSAQTSWRTGNSNNKKDQSGELTKSSFEKPSDKYYQDTPKMPLSASAIPKLIEDLCPSPFAVTNVLKNKYHQAFEQSKLLLKKNGLVTCGFLAEMCKKLVNVVDVVQEFDSLELAYEFLVEKKLNNIETWKPVWGAENMDLDNGIETWKKGWANHRDLNKNPLKVPIDARHCDVETLKAKCRKLELTERHEAFLQKADECYATAQPLFTIINNVLKVRCLGNTNRTSWLSAAYKAGIAGESGVFVDPSSGLFKKETQEERRTLEDRVKDNKPVYIFAEDNDSWNIRVENRARPAFEAKWTELFDPNLANDMITLVKSAIREK